MFTHVAVPLHMSQVAVAFGVSHVLPQQHDSNALLSLKRHALLQQVPATRRKGSAEAQLTLPKWEFSCGEDRGTMKAVRNAHTLKSHHIASLDAADGTLRRGTVQHGSLPQPHYMVSLSSSGGVMHTLFRCCGVQGFQHMSLEAAVPCLLHCHPYMSSREASRAQQTRRCRRPVVRL